MGYGVSFSQQTNITFKTLRTLDAPHARQGVAVDSAYIYVIGSQTIIKRDKKTFKKISEWKGPKDGPIHHLDSGVIVNGKLYAAQSNYPQRPMASSIEIWSAKTMKHIGTHSFGIHWGSATWVDRYNGYWWVGFANYNKVYGTNKKAYGNKYWTQVVKFDNHWRWLEAWTLPKKMLKQLGVYSNSGGSWGPNGRLYLTGHDGAKLYVVKLAEAGSTLKLMDIVKADIFGQGIAWDRTVKNPVLYGIIKDKVVRVLKKIKTDN